MSYISYRDLDIYKIAHSLAIEIHEITLKLPRYELYEEGSQLRRSSKSIVSNIVEGFGRRRYKKEFIQFLNYGLASCDETREHIELIYKTGSFRDEIRYNYFIDKYNELGKKINNFMKSVIRSHNSYPVSSIKHPASKIDGLIPSKEVVQ